VIKRYQATRLAATVVKVVMAKVAELLDRAAMVVNQLSAAEATPLILSKVGGIIPFVVQVK
jgi:hypothetical protein